jgi:hypothetical protein
MAEAPPPLASPARPRGAAWRRLVLVLAALASGYLGALLAVRPLLKEFATRPPVLILDAARALRGVPAARVGSAIAQQRDLARRLAAGGVLVLDPQAVVAAPPGLYLAPAGGRFRPPGAHTRRCRLDDGGHPRQLRRALLGCAAARPIAREGACALLMPASY